MVHISDITKALEMVLLDKGPAGRWQITSGKAIRVVEIVEYIKSISGNALNVQFDESLDRAMDCYELWSNAPTLPNWTASKELLNWLSTQLAS
jgi:nucleoside-diphosphate-sugar epimerase